MPETFRVGITRDFLRADGTLAFGNIGLDLLDRAPGITREFLESHSPELQPEQIRGFDALLVLAPSVTAATLTGADRLALVSLCQPVLPSRSRQSPYACKSSRRIGSVRNRRPVA